MPEHLCYDTYWGMWTPELVDILNRIADEDAVNMTLPTYLALCSLKADLEFALDVKGPDPLPHQGHGTNFTPEDEAILRAVILHFQTGLADDRFDATPNSGCHAGAPPGWIHSGTAQNQVVDAIRVLGGDSAGPVPPFCPPNGVLGKVRSALGSKWI